jgi:hypothetical protein
MTQILTPKLAQSTKIIDPKYTPVKGSLSLEISAFRCAIGPLSKAKLSSRHMSNGKVE